MPIKYCQTYETWTPEDIDAGDTDDKGFVVTDWNRDTVAEIVEEFLSQGSVEASSSEFHPGLWYQTIDAEEDYKTGARTYYAWHLDRSTPIDVQREVYEALRRK